MNNPQRSRLNTNLGWCTAHVFAISVNLQRFFRLHPQPFTLKVIDLPDLQVPPVVHRGKHASESKGINSADYAHIEQAVVYSCVRRNPHPIAVDRSISEGSESSWLVAACDPVAAFAPGADFHTDRRKAKNRWSQG